MIRYKFGWCCGCAVFYVFLCVATLMTVKNVNAQSAAGEWSMPVTLFQGTGSNREPALAADQAGNLHAVWAYGDKSATGMVIMYARWDGTQWTTPIDIIATDGVIQGPSLVVDRSGRIHLIWHGSGNLLYYSSADAQAAQRATAWARPSGLASANLHAAIMVDEEGVVYVVYPAPLDGGVEVITSADRGVTWTLPAPVARPVHAMATADFVRIAAAPDGDLHVVWTELMLPDGFPSLGVFYSRSEDRGQSWSDPVEVAGDGHAEINVLAVDRDEIHVAWNGLSGISGRYHRWSGDGGRTWSAPDPIVLPEMKGGSTGPPGLAADSAGHLYAVVNTGDTVHREGLGEFGATIFLAWTGSGWTPPLNLSSVDPDYSSKFNEESVLAIVGGNQLHVLFLGDATRSVWHTMAGVTAPSITAQPFEEALQSSALSAQQQGADALQNRINTKSTRVQAAPALGASPGLRAVHSSEAGDARRTIPSLFVSTVLAAVVVAATFLVQAAKRRR